MLIYFAFCFIALMGFCGLALDVGRMEARSLQLQTAADNAAMAYAVESGLRGSINSSDFTTAANAEVVAYAAGNGLPTPAMTLQIGSSTGPFVGNTATIQATVKQTMPTLILGILQGSGSIQLTRTAVAALPPCSTIYGALAVSSNSTITSPCPLAVGTTLTVDGSSKLFVQTLVEGSAASSSVLGTASPAPSYDWPSEKHPLSYSIFETETGCTSPSSSVSGTVSLPPGLYCALQINNATVTLSPGYYYINGGITITNSTIQGGPITMSLVDNPPEWGYGQFILTNSHWNVSAPTTTSANGDAGVVIISNQPDVPGTPALVATGSTITSDGVLSFGGSTISIANSVLRDAGHTFRLSVTGLIVSNSQITLSDDYSQFPGGGALAFTTPLLQ